MARIIALANQKGGVSKTTSAINLGAALAELSRRVLLVDLDPQASLTAAVGINPADLPASVHDVLVHKTALPEIIVTAADMHVAPSTIDLAEAEIHLLHEIGREQVLAEALADVTEMFDDILIDCPPSLGQLTINALTAADAVLIPIESSYLAPRGMDQLMDTIAKIRRRSNTQLRFLGVLPTMYEGRTIHEREVLDDLRRRFPDQVFAPIPRSVRFRDSTLAGLPLLAYDSSHAGAAAYRAYSEPGGRPWSSQDVYSTGAWKKTELRHYYRGNRASGCGGKEVTSIGRWRGCSGGVSNLPVTFRTFV